MAHKMGCLFSPLPALCIQGGALLPWLTVAVLVHGCDSCFPRFRAKRILREARVDSLYGFLIRWQICNRGGCDNQAGFD